MIKTIAAFLILTGCCAAADLTGNWLVAQPSGDGTVRKSYFDLKQDGSKISGHFRVTQIYYTIVEGNGGPDGFTFTGRLQDGK